MDIIGILENVGFDLKVFIFNTINFVILIFLLKKFLFDKVMSVIDERERLIDEGLTNAAKADENLKSANDERLKIIEDAKARKEAMLDEAKKEADTLHNEVKSKALAEAGYIRDKAQQDSLKTKEKIMSSVQKNIAKIVTKELKDKIEG